MSGRRACGGGPRRGGEPPAAAHGGGVGAAPDGAGPRVDAIRWRNADAAAARPAARRSRQAADRGLPASPRGGRGWPPTAGCRRRAAVAAGGRPRAAGVAVCAALLLAPAVARPAVGVDTDEPRSFGYTVGDTVQRRIVLHVPAGLVLDEDSLPAVGRKGRAIELRSLSRRVLGQAAGTRDHELRLVYQVFVAPPEVRTFELPPLQLRWRGQPRDEDVRVDAWPLVVSPLLPLEVSPRRGLGEWQPDAPPPLIDTAPGRRRLAAYGALLALLLGALLAVHAVLPWLGRQRRPFERAWRALRAAAPPRTAGQRHDAFRHLHAALNQTAGQVLFAAGVDRFVAARPQFAPLRSELAAFFGRSQQAFFAVDGATADRPPSASPAPAASASQPADDGAWLLAFCRRCRDVERGTG